MLELLLALALSTKPAPVVAVPVPATPVEDDADAELDDPFGVITHTIEEKEQALGLAGPSGLRRGQLDFQYSTPTRAELGDLTHVSVESGTIVPAFGYYPLRASIDNAAGPTQRLRLSYESNTDGRRAITRTVEVQAGERRTVILPVPVEMRFGNLRAAGPGIGKSNTVNAFFTPAYRPQTSVLALGTAAEFERFAGKPRPAGGNSYDRQERAQVQLMLAAEAPTEFASYVGYDAVVVPAALFDTLPEGLRRALEAYAASGGTLVLEKQPRNLELFPLLEAAAQSPSGRTPYGFGVVSFAPPKDVLQSQVVARDAMVTPTGRREAWERNGGGGDSLLPQATAPLGRFLFIIGLFTLAIGPGSVLVARRRGSAMLLLTIPLTAFLTCAVIISTSLLGDGFTVHAHFEGYTLLDSKAHRAVTAGLGAYYANLAPGRTRFPAGVAPLPPTRNGDAQAVAFDWDDGVTIPFDFLPSRSYREWGFLAVEPTRARLSVTANDKTPTVQNALGAQVLELRLRWKGREWTVSGLDDGAAAAATPSHGGALADAQGFRFRGADRFAHAVPARVLEPLGEGEFLAKVRGEGFIPLGGLTLEQHESQHLIRGTVSP